MLTADEATRRVTRGAARLDQAKPGWWNQIDEGTLSLESCGRCLLGQLYHGFWLGAAVLWNRTYQDTRTAHSPEVALGFVVANEDTEHRRRYEMLDAYALLQEAWIAAIADRRLAAGDNQPTEQPDDKRGTEGEGFRPDFLFAHD